jgi:hypothetical protein
MPLTTPKVAMPDLVFEAERQLQLQQGLLSEHRKEIQPEIEEV